MLKKTVSPPQPNTVYPSPRECARIVERRRKILTEALMASFESPPDDAYVDRLIERYGPHEVLRVLQILHDRTANAEFIGEDAKIYREYRFAFARFGGDRRWLGRCEFEQLAWEHMQLFGKRQLGPGRILPRRPSARERELEDFLLAASEFWEDLRPPAPPPRPADWQAPAAGQYTGAVQSLLGWGIKLYDASASGQLSSSIGRNRKRWQSAIPDLLRMALDPGLLEGWPGDASSWAPYHALYILGRLRAHACAGPLLALLDRENDWLSDLLALVWPQMGPPAEPPLWDYLADSTHDAQKRGVVTLGLGYLALAHAKRRQEIGARLAWLLRDAPATDATANAFIVEILGRLDFTPATEVIRDAVAENRVDLTLVQSVDIDLLGPEEG